MRPLLPSRPIQRVDPQQEGNPERQDHREQQQVPAARRLARNEIRHGIAEQQAQQRADRRHLQGREIDDPVVAILEQEGVVLQGGVQALHAIRAALEQRREGRLRDHRIGEADLQDDQERRQEEQQQPQVRHRGRPPQPGEVVSLGDGGGHARNRMVLATSHERYTSSSHSTVRRAVRLRFCALTCSRSRPRASRGTATDRRSSRGRAPSP